MRIVAPLVLALALVGCAPAPSTPAAAALPTLAPGLSTLPSTWLWPQQGAPSPELAAALDGRTTPEAIAAWLQANAEWRDDYDTGRFLSPAEVVRDKRAVCSGFARFWVYALARLGIRAEFVAFWGPASAHAVAVFRAPDGRYRLASNQFYYSALDLDPGNRGRDAALDAAGMEFYGDQVGDLLVFSDSGQVMQRKQSVKAQAVPLAAPAGRGLFSVRR